MRFLVNMNVPRELGRKLLAAGHQCRHARDAGMAKASDVAIMDMARATGEVIIFRVRNTDPENLFAGLSRSWAEIEEAVVKGALITVEDKAVRIRTLPFD